MYYVFIKLSYTSLTNYYNSFKVVQNTLLCLKIHTSWCKTWSRWVPDRPNKCQQNGQTTIWNHFKNSHRWPSELTQVTPKIPNDHKDMFQFWQNAKTMQECSSTIYESVMKTCMVFHEDHKYPWMIHGESSINTHGLLPRNYELLCSHVGFAAASGGFFPCEVCLDFQEHEKGKDARLEMIAIRLANPSRLSV